MNRVSLSFRDYAVHLFPGTLALVSLYLLVCPLRGWVEGNKVAATLFVFLGGYVVGFVLDAIFHDAILKVLRMVPWWRDPLPYFFAAESGDTSIRAAAKRLLENHVGHGVVQNEGRNSLVYFCIRYIETKNERAADFIDRIISLENLTVNLIVPLALLSGVCIYINEWFCALVIAIGALALPFKNCHHRTWLGRTVLRYYLVLREEELRADTPQ